MPLDPHFDRRAPDSLHPQREAHLVATVGTPFDALLCMEANERPTTSAKKFSMTEFTISKYRG
jgi:hypothetical protein